MIAPLEKLGRRILIGAPGGDAAIVLLEYTIRDPESEEFMELTAEQLRTAILSDVVTRFVNLNESTSRRALLIKFKNQPTSNAIGSLLNQNIIRRKGSNAATSEEEYLPTAAAFEFCGNIQLRDEAKRATTVVLHTLQQMFVGEQKKEGFVLEDLKNHIDALYPNQVLDIATLKLGLYLAKDFSVLAGYQLNSPEDTEVRSFQIGEGAISLANPDVEWDRVMASYKQAEDTLSDAEESREESVRFEVRSPEGVSAFYVSTDVHRWLVAAQLHAAVHRTTKILTTEALLFAAIEDGRNQTSDALASFLSDAVARLPGGWTLYEQTFGNYFSRHPDPTDRPSNAVQCSSNFAKVLRSAEQTATDVAPKGLSSTPTIQFRHLLAALLNTDNTVAKRAMQDLGLQLQGLKEQLSQLVDGKSGLDQDLNMRQETLEAHQEADFLSGGLKVTVTPGDTTSNTPLSIDLASISDVPTTDDELGFQPYVIALSKFLLSTQTSGPLTLSIEGEWGSGKSSFMLQLDKLLSAPASPLRGEAEDSPSIRTFWFNAWRQDKQEAVWAAFALAFSRELRDKSTRRWTGGFRMAYERAKVNPDLSGLASASIKATVWIAGIIFAFVALRSLGANWLKWLLSGTVTLAALVQGFRGMKEVFGSPFETQLTQYLRGPDYAQRVSVVEQFHTDFKRMLDTYADSVDKIFVFIDDVDRCEVPKAAELMQAFNLLIGDDKRLIFIIGMDREKIAAGIASKYKDLVPFLYGKDAANCVDYGFSFLEKFIQLPFLIPAPSVERLEKFCSKASNLSLTTHTALGKGASANATGPTEPARNDIVPASQTPAPDAEPGADRNASVGALPTETQKRVERELESTGDSASVRDIAKMIAVTVHRSPRKLKQFINVFRLKAYIANQLGLFDDDKNGKQQLTFEQLGKFVAISLTWPKVIGELAADPALLSSLEQAAVAKAAMQKPTTEHTSSAWVQVAPLTALLQYGCIEKPVWPFDPLRYSLQGIDLVPMLEISPQVVRERPKKSPPTQDATAVSLATEKRTSEFSSEQEGTA
jgi:hypothetical protein